MKGKSIKKLLAGLGISVMLVLGMSTVAMAANEDMTVTSETKGSLSTGINNLRQTAIDKTSYTIAWDAIPEAVKYEVAVRRCDSSSSEYTLKTTTTASSAKVSVTAGYRWDVKVTAYDSSNYTRTAYLYGVSTVPSSVSVTKRYPYLYSEKYSYDLKTQLCAKGVRVKNYNYKTKKTTTTYESVSSISGKAYTNSLSVKQNAVSKITLTPYAEMNGKKYYGKDNVQYVLQQPRLSKKTATSSSMTAKWTKMSGVTNYSVYVKKPGGKWKKVKTTKATTYRLTGMKPNKQYGIKVVANKKVGNKTWKSTNTEYWNMKIYR